MLSDPEHPKTAPSVRSPGPTHPVEPQTAPGPGHVEQAQTASGTLTRKSNKEPPDESPADTVIVERVKRGDLAAFELIMRRYNQRIFRIVRGILSDESEAEDVVQEAYVLAFQHLHQFEGRASFSTWLTKIAIYEAFARRKRRARLLFVDTHDSGLDAMPPSDQNVVDQVSNQQLRTLLAAEVAQLPSDERVVFIMRMVEGMSTREAAECLELTESNVKVRLQRARQRLQTRIDGRIGSEARMLFQFDGIRCDRIVARAMCRIRSLSPAT